MAGAWASGAMSRTAAPSASPWWNTQPGGQRRDRSGCLGALRPVRLEFPILSPGSKSPCESTAAPRMVPVWRPCSSRIRCQAATRSWTKSRQWETERTLFSSARATHVSAGEGQRRVALQRRVAAYLVVVEARRPGATQRCLNPGFSERIGNSRRTAGNSGTREQIKLRTLQTRRRENLRTPHHAAQRRKVSLTTGPQWTGLI